MIKKLTPRQREILKLLAENPNNVIVYGNPFSLGPRLVYYRTELNIRTGKNETRERTEYLIRPVFWRLRDSGWLREAPDNQWRITDNGREAIAQ